MGAVIAHSYALRTEFLNELAKPLEKIDTLEARKIEQLIRDFEPPWVKAERDRKNLLKILSELEK